MAEETGAETDAFMGAFDQARNIGHHKLGFIYVDDAELRRQRGERIVGDLGPGARRSGEQRRLARVGQADQPDIGQHLEAQPDPAFGGGPAGIGAARRAVGG